MTETTLTLDGMYCSMCESHVNEAVRKLSGIHKVSSNHKKGTTRILSDEPLDEAALHSVLDPTGYRIVSLTRAAVDKAHTSGLFGRLF